MRHAAITVIVVHTPAERVAVSGVTRRAGMLHIDNCRVGEDWLLVREMVAQVEHAEAEQLMRGGPDGGCSAVVEVVKWNRLQAVIVADGGSGQAAPRADRCPRHA